MAYSSMRPAEELLRASGERLMTIFSATEEGLTLQTANGQVVECNDAACRILGLTREQLTGRDSLDPRWRAIHEDGSPFPGETHPAFIAFRTQKAQRNVIQGIHRPDGSLTWIRVTSVPVIEDDGVTRVVVSSFTDITAQRELEMTLRDSERRLRLATEVSGVGVWDWDVNTNQITWDHQMHILYGLPERTDMMVTYADWAGAVHPEDLPLQEQLIQDLVRRGGRGRREFRICRPDGEVRMILAHETTVTDAAGSVVHVVGVNRDITDERNQAAALREREERFRASFEYAGIGMALLGLDGRWIKANAALCRIVGYEEAELRERTFQDITHPDDLDTDLAHARELLEGKRTHYQMEKRYLHREGHIVWVRLTGSVVRDAHGRPVHFIAQIEDISEQRLLLQSLALARDQALEASRLKSEFLANISHEIRTPMNGIIGMTELLLEGDLRTDQREMANVVRTSGENLLTIINDLLDFAKIESGKFNIESADFELRTIFAETLALITPSCRRKHLELSFDWQLDGSPSVKGDPVRLRQVLTNLLGNAVKFTESGSIGLSVRPLADHPGRLHFRVEVSDTGIGISQGQMQRLFQPFVQADGSATRHYGGTGLGLAISRQLVQLMGGTIGVVSGATGGSTFWFELELEKIVPSPARPAGSNRPFADLNERLSGLKVLVVEDNASNQLVTRKLLECQGHRVTIATNGREALAALQRDSFDAILMDCQMPEMDGYTTTAKIRSGEVPGLDTRIPIIALTANALPSDRAKCLEAGMNDYLSKPVRPAELAASFHRCRLKSAAR